MTVLQRLLSSAISRQLHAAWHEAAAHVPVRLTALTTGADGAAVAQLGYRSRREAHPVQMNR